MVSASAALHTVWCWPVWALATSHLAALLPCCPPVQRPREPRKHLPTGSCAQVGCSEQQQPWVRSLSSSWFRLAPALLSSHALLPAAAPHLASCLTQAWRKRATCTAEGLRAWRAWSATCAPPSLSAHSRHAARIQTKCNSHQRICHPKTHGHQRPGRSASCSAALTTCLLQCIHACSCGPESAAGVSPLPQPAAGPR